MKMKNITKTKIDGVIFILLGLHAAWLWFLTFFLVFVAVEKGEKEKWFLRDIDQVPTMSNMLSAIDIPPLVQSVAFLIPTAFFLAWGIWTIKRKSNKSSEPA